MIYTLKDKRAALLVIDVQKEYFDPNGPAFVEEAVMAFPNINLLIDTFAEVGQSVIYVQHAFKADGSDVGRMGDFDDDEGEDSFVEGTSGVELAYGLKLVEGAPRIWKNRYDSFTNTGLDALLNERSITTLVIVGFMTSFCCDSTVRTAHSKDYEVLFVSDAVGGPDLEYDDGTTFPSSEVRRAVSAQLAAGFAEVLQTEDVLKRLR